MYIYTQITSATALSNRWHDKAVNVDAVMISVHSNWASEMQCVLISVVIVYMWVM